MTCLLGYGVHENRRTVQKMMAHLEFRRYEAGIITRDEFIENVATKFKLSVSEVDEILFSIIKKCTIDHELIKIALQNSEYMLGLMDIPYSEFKYIKNSRPDLVKLFEGLNLVALEDVQYSWVVISRDPEVASVHRSMGFTSIPYSPSQLECIRGYLRTLNPAACYQEGLVALNHVLETYELKSIIEMDLPPNSESEISTDIGILKEYFNPILIALYYPEILLPELEAQLVSFVTSGPFGYFGIEFNRLPADIDTMSLNIATLYEMGSITYKEGCRAMEWVLSNNENGILQVYFDKDRPRVDHVVLCNVLYACYTLGLENSPIARANEELVHRYFLNGGYTFGTKYYHSPETFLFHFGRILTKFGDSIPNFYFTSF